MNNLKENFQKKIEKLLKTEIIFEYVSIIDQNFINNFFYLDY